MPLPVNAHLTVTVDVLAGTSAGGINAALLGLSSAAGADLAKLRDLWLTTGSMDLLLRDPGEKNPPSLTGAPSSCPSHSLDR
jgi:predicted acylesterase/phospholipase RssA